MCFESFFGLYEGVTDKSPYIELLQHVASTDYKPISRIRAWHDALISVPTQTEQTMRSIIETTIIPILLNTPNRANDTDWRDLDFYQAITIVVLQNQPQLNVEQQLNHLANQNGYILENLLPQWWNRYNRDMTSVCLRYSARIMIHFPDIFLHQQQFPATEGSLTEENFRNAIENITAAGEQPDPKTPKNTASSYWGKSFLLPAEKRSFTLVGLLAFVSLLISVWILGTSYLYLHSIREENKKSFSLSRFTCKKVFKR